MTNMYKRDLRWPASLLMFGIGVGMVLITRVVNDDSWSDFGINAAYSIGWTLLTFGALYVISGRFGDWEWGREDHDLAKMFGDALVDEGEA